MATRVLLAAGEAIRSLTARRSSGDILITSTTWVSFDVALDLVLAAAVGDKIEVYINGCWNNEGWVGFMDCATLVSSAPVTYFSSGTGSQPASGLGAWLGGPSVYAAVGGPSQITLGSGDISGGTVTLRLLAKTSNAFGKSMQASSTNPFQFIAKNIGPG